MQYAATDQREIPPDSLSVFRVRTVAEVIDGAFRLYRRNFRTFLAIVLAAAIPIHLVSYLLDIFVLGTYSAPDLETFSESTFLSSGMVNQLSSLKTYFETALEFIPQWALTSAVASVLLMGGATIGEAYRAVGRDLGRLVGLVLLYIGIVLALFSPMILSLLLLLLGGASGEAFIAMACFSPVSSIAYLIVSVRLQVVVPAAVVEALTPRRAISRSWELTRNYWWRTVAFSIVLSILSAVVATGPAALLVGLIGAAAPLDLYGNLALTRGIGILTTAVFAPIEMGAIALYYFDQRVRKEGFDLDTAITERYGGQPPVASSLAAGYGPEPRGEMAGVHGVEATREADYFPILGTEHGSSFDVADGPKRAHGIQRVAPGKGERRAGAGQESGG